MSELNQYLDFAKELADEAGKIMRKYFRSEEAGTTWKSEDKTPLTVADTKINSMVVKEIIKKYPKHGLIGEEESIEIDDDYVWICDPIDGTMTFTHGLPLSSFNLALMHKGKVIVSVLLDPFMDRLYWATLDGGAYLNGRKLDLRQQNDESEHKREFVNLEVTGRIGGHSIFADPDLIGKIFSIFNDDKFAILRLYSIAYSGGLVASGDIEATIFSGKHPWDFAAPSLIIEEAGGVVTDAFGKPILRYDQDMQGVLAGNSKIHAEILKTLLPIFKSTKRQ